MALNPQREPLEEEDDSYDGPRKAWSATAGHRGPRWWWTVLGIVAIVAIGVIIYFALYGGGGRTTPTTGSGGYFVLALSAEQLRRLRNRRR